MFTMSSTEYMNMHSHDIAVIGIACRYPGADTPRMLWENILSRRQQFRRIPRCRLSLSDYQDDDPSRPEKTYATRVSVLEGFRFDRTKHRVPKSIYDRADIAHWLALDVALQALDDATLGDTVPKSRTGVFLGNTLTGEQFRSVTLRQRWPFIERAIQLGFSKQNISNTSLSSALEAAKSVFYSAFPETNEDTIPGSLSNTIAGRICNHLDLQGGGYVVDGACASSLLSTINACERLNLGHIDLAIAGGVDVSLDTFELIGFAKIGALTPDLMRVYDKRAQGFIGGEGAGFVVLKRLVDANRDKNYVYATIKGSGISSDGRGGLTTPTSYGQSLAIERAYKMSGYSPHCLHFIEGHGTGTRVGDRVELEGIQLALDRIDAEEGIDTQEEKKQYSGDRRQTRRIGITSFKSLVGHTKAAAGIGGLIKAICAVNQRVIPPTVGCESPSDVFESTATSLYPVLNGELLSADTVMRAGVSAMGFGGINSHIALESATKPSDKLNVDTTLLLASAWTSELLLFSSNSIDEMQLLLDVFLGEAVLSTPAELTDLAAKQATTFSPKKQIRIALILKSILEADKVVSEAKTLLATSEDQTVLSSKSRKIWIALGRKLPRIGFVFPGQGSQQLRSAEGLVRRYPWAKQLVEDTDRWLADIGAEPIASLLFRSVHKAKDKEEVKEWQSALQCPSVTEPIVALSSMIWHRYLTQELGILPIVVAGHSLGELTALYVAGAYDAKALIQLTAIRGQYLKESPPGTMAALACSKIRAETLLEGIDGRITVANNNSPNQVVVSGDIDAVTELLTLARKAKIAGRRLSVTGAFHTDLVADAAKRVLHDARLPKGSATLALPLITTIKHPGGCIEKDESGSMVVRSVEKHMHDQMVHSVDFLKATRELSAACDVIIEVGTGQILQGLMSDSLAGLSEQSGILLSTEANANTQDSFLQLVGALAIQGALPNLDQIYSERLSRPYKAAKDRSFIENQCETIAVVDSQLSHSTAGIVDEWLPEKTASNGTKRDAYIEQRQDFFSSLKQILQNDFESFRDRSNVSVSKSNSNTSMSDRGGVRPREESDVSLEDRLIALAAEQTGFPRNSIQADHKLLDDLRLDSIKTSEFFLKAAQLAGVDTSKVDTTLFTNATLLEISNTLRDLKKKGGERSNRVHSSPTSQNKQSDNIGFFQRVWEAESLDDDSRDWTRYWKGRTVLVCASENDAFGKEISHRITNVGATVRRYTWGNNPVKVDTAGIQDIVAMFPTLDPDQQQRNLESLATSLVDLGTLTEGLGNTPPVLTWMQHPKSTVGSIPDRWSAGAFLSTLYLERRHLRIRTMLFDRSLSSDIAFEELSREHLLGGTGPTLSDVERDRNTSADFENISIDTKRQRHVMRVKPIASHCYSPRKASLNSNDLVLVTGGAKGITAECAISLGKEKGVRLALVGSSPKDQIMASLRRFETEGIEAHYFQCDLSKDENVATLISTVRKQLGPIVALVHGAALNHPNPIGQTSVAQGLREMAPKLGGGSALLTALENSPPKLIVMFSSVIGVTGMMGNCWYALANECLALQLDEFLRRNPSSEGISLAYTAWEGTGMGVDLGTLDSLRAVGVDTLPIPAGVQYFMHHLNVAPHVNEVVISGSLGNLPTWRLAEATGIRVDPTFRTQDLLPFPSSRREKNEIIREYTLNFERDTFLHDHVINGTCIVSTSVILEMIAATVSDMCEEPQFDSVEITDLSFNRPIVVSMTEATMIQIRVVSDDKTQFIEPSTNGAVSHPRKATVFRADIRSSADRFFSSYLCATVNVDSFSESLPIEDDGSDRDLLQIETNGWHPESRGVYDSLLFHGPSFRRISSVRYLDDRCTYCSIRATDQYLGVLGDYFARDAALQSAQFALTPRQGLPQRILHWRFYDLSLLKKENDIHVISRLVSDDSDASLIRTRVYASSHHLLEEIVWEAKEVSAPNTKHQGLLPTVSDLCSGWSLESAIIKSCFDDIPSGLVDSLPVCLTQRVPNVHMISREKRQALHRSFLKQVVGSDIEINWNDLGAPIVADGSSYSNLSISHSEDLSVYMLYDQSIACDLVDGKQRSIETWKLLLPLVISTKLETFLEKSRSLNAPQGAFLWATHEIIRKLGCTVSDVTIVAVDETDIIDHPRWCIISVDTATSKKIRVTLLRVKLLGNVMVFGFGTYSNANERTEAQLTTATQLLPSQENNPFQLVIKS